MFKDTPEGKTHHYNDDCKPPHVKPNSLTEKDWESDFQDLLNCYRTEDAKNKEINTLRRRPNTVIEQELKEFIRSTVAEAERGILERACEELEKVKEDFAFDNGKVTLTAAQDSIRSLQPKE